LLDLMSSSTIRALISTRDTSVILHLNLGYAIIIWDYQTVNLIGS